MLRILIISVLSFSISILIGRFLYKSDLPPSLIDQPNSRKIHTRPTPLIGGITILFTLLIMIIFLNLYDSLHVQLYIIFSLYFFFVGLFDDLFRWNYLKKLTLQVIGTIAFVAVVSNHISNISFSSFVSGNIVVNYVIIFLWTLFLINSFNFFDGINFLAGSLAVVFYTSYILYFISLEYSYPASIFLILIFAIIGFLFYNRAPAKMFLGDAGSMFLGFTIAGTPLLFLSKSTSNINLTFFVIVLFILISDTTFVLINRLIKNKNPFQPDKTHLHHQLLNLNFRNRYVVLIIVISTILHSLFAFFSGNLSVYIILLILIIINFIFIILPRYFPLVVKKYDLWGLKNYFDKFVNRFKNSSND